MNNGRLRRTILAAACIVQGGLCILAPYVIAAILIAGKNYSHPDEEFRRCVQWSWELFCVGGIFIFAAITLAIWPDKHE